MSQSVFTLLRPFVTLQTSITSPPAFIFHIIPSKLKTSEDLKHLEAFLFISSQDKNRGFHCALKEKKSVCFRYLRLSQKMRSHRVHLYRRHRNGRHISTRDPNPNTMSTLTLKRFPLAHSNHSRVGMLTHFLLLYVLRETLPEEEIIWF